MPSLIRVIRVIRGYLCFDTIQFGHRRQTIRLASHRMIGGSILSPENAP